MYICTVKQRQFETILSINKTMGSWTSSMSETKNGLLKPDPQFSSFKIPFPHNFIVCYQDYQCLVMYLMAHKLKLIFAFLKMRKNENQ
jgi:hypothetical protein